MTTTMTATDRAEINRRNAQKSTGPRTPEGKDRSRFNAVKHGMTAKTLVLPGEDVEALQVRIDAWTADLQPRNDVEQHLVEQAVHTSWQLDRADRAATARLAGIIRNTTDDEARRQETEAAELGRRLFWDRRGPLALYPHFPLRDQLLADRKPRTSFSGLIDDPDDPDRLVSQLESTAAGCQWLLDAWAELRTRLEEGWAWQSPEKLKAIRLLGKQPLDAADDDAVATVFLASSVMGPRDPKEVDAFAELWNELLPGEEQIFKQRLLDRQVDELLPEDEDHARSMLLDLVERVSARLKTLAASHRQRAEADAAEQASRLSFDASKEGERLRRFQISCGRSLLRTLDTLLKIRRSIDAPLPTLDQSDPAGNREPESVHETDNRIIFGESWGNDDSPVESAPALEAFTTIVSSVPADVDLISRPVDAAIVNDPDPSSEPEPGPAPATDHQNREIEPTTPATDHQNRENEPTAPVGGDDQVRSHFPLTRTKTSPKPGDRSQWIDVGQSRTFESGGCSGA
jgi:hypothetical protein